MTHCHIVQLFELQLFLYAFSAGQLWVIPARCCQLGSHRHTGLAWSVAPSELFMIPSEYYTDMHCWRRNCWDLLPWGFHMSPQSWNLRATCKNQQH